MLVDELWSRCTELLQQEISAQMFSTWIKPLQPEIQGRSLVLLAPNRFVLQWVADKYSARLQSLVKEVTQEQLQEVSLAVGSRSEPQTSINSIQPDLKTAVAEKPTTSVQGNVFSHSSSSDVNNLTAQKNNSLESFQANLQKLVEQQVPAVMEKAAEKKSSSNKGKKFDGVDKYKSTLNPLHTFDNLVEGKSNQIARAASLQVAEAPGVYNPLFIYGGVGLGKTHLMHAVGNQIMQLNPNAKVVYLNSERFVQDMVKALQINAINDFKRFYRNLDALLIDDIQFFIGKDRSQEEFFYTFNSLLEGGKQIIVTSDRYPKEIGVEERLKSRFSWGLTVAIEPPELELRVAILMKKAEAARVNLSQEVAFFIAKKIRSHVRDLEGALNRVVADSHFKGQPITIDLVRESLKDLFAVQDKQVSIENIQRSVADYYKIKIADLHSKRRNRSIARPRQVAMALAKELTSHSLPEIGDAFGGRDHTTVLHACKRVKSLQNESPDIREDWKNLLRLLTS